MALFTPHQTGTSAGCGTGAFCSGAGLALLRTSTRLKRQLPKGTSPKSVSFTAVAANVVGLTMQSENLGSQGVAGIGEPGVVEWAAGNYTVRLNISTANVNVTWTGTYICRVSGAGACGGLGTIGSLTGQTISLATTGVKTMTVSGALTSVNENDQIFIVCLFSNAGIMTQSFAWLPNQIIDTPIRVPDRRNLLGVGP